MPGTSNTEESSLSARLVVLVSGTGTNLQALLDACVDPGYGARVVAVGSDRDDAQGLERARAAGRPTFVVRVCDHPDRAAWNHVLTEAVASYEPDLVVFAGFMRIVDRRFVERFRGRAINTHPALLPAFPGAQAVHDTLTYGAKVTGVTIHLVEVDVDSGPVVAQCAVPVLTDDDVQRLHERIKSVERGLLVETVGLMARRGYHIEGRRVLMLDPDHTRAGA